MAGEESLAAKLRGEVEGKMSLSLSTNYRPRWRSSKRKSWMRKPLGRTAEETKVALSHLKALIEGSGASEKFPR